MSLGIRFRRRGVLALAAVALLLPTHAQALDGDDPLTGGQPFFGIDAVVHEAAPVVVSGANGELYWGPDFDLACHYGAKIIRRMRDLQQLAKVIRDSGRRVIWTVAPSKTNVLGSRLASLPHGHCDAKGLAQQDNLLDEFDDPSYLPLRQRLERDHRQMYWKTDPHWTTVAGAVYATRLARVLDPALAKRQRYTYGTETRVGLFTTLTGGTTPETLPTAQPAGKVTVRTAPDSAYDWAGYPNLVFDHSWTSSPRSMTYKGHTLVLGESFTLCALPALRPLFRHGRFLWYNSVTPESIIQAVVDADTVVIEMLQTLLPYYSPLTFKSFRHQLRKAVQADQRG